MAASLPASRTSEFPVRMAVSQYEVLVHVVWETLGRYWPGGTDGWCSIVGGPRADFRPLAPLHPPGRLVPEWLAPVQHPGENTLAENLDRVRRTPPGAIAAELASMYPHGPPPQLRPYAHDPAAALERFTRAVQDFWDQHLRVRWPAMRSILEREVLMTGAALVSTQGQHALGGLSPRIGVDEQGFVIRGCERIVRAAVDDRTVLLVPTVAGPDALSGHLDQPGVLQLAYAARGSDELWASEPVSHAQELTALLGASRARILVAVRRPETTSDLAVRLGRSPANVSFHLQGLARMGLVDKNRRGRRVLYRATPRGASLVALFLDR